MAQWRPASHHAAAFPHLLNSGIISTLIDCHCICMAISAFHRRGQGSAALPAWCVTAALNVTFLTPTPVGAVTLRARIGEMTARKAVVACSLTAGETETARGEVVAVRLSAPL